MSMLLWSERLCTAVTVPDAVLYDDNNSVCHATRGVAYLDVANLGSTRRLTAAEMHARQ